MRSQNKLAVQRLNFVFPAHCEEARLWNFVFEVARVVHSRLVHIMLTLIERTTSLRFPRLSTHVTLAVYSLRDALCVVSSLRLACLRTRRSLSGPRLASTARGWHLVFFLLGFVR